MKHVKETKRNVQKKESNEKLDTLSVEVDDAELYNSTIDADGPQTNSTQHESVMVKEVLTSLALQQGDIVVDATAGEGGHSEAMLADNQEIELIALDADPRAIALTEKRLARFKKRAQVVESNFAQLNKVLKREGAKEVNKVLFDLGWNSGQLTSGRGFSFLHNEPLNMSYGKKPASGFTAREVLNEWEEKTLADVFFGYGEERYARRIAEAIVLRREYQPIETTIELEEIIRDNVPAAYRRGRIHPATRVFQALRIAVNDELSVIERGVAGAWKHLSCGGRIAVISFHSVEDRLVKQIFAELVKKNEGKLLYKKPLVPSRGEVVANKRARSAKLRVIEKICTP